MSVVPKHTDPAALWAALSATPRPFDVVDLPRKDASGQPVGQVALVVLKVEEQMACAAQAGKFARKMLREKDGDLSPSHPDFQDLYNNQAALEVLWRACRMPGNLELRAFPNPEQIRSQFTDDEIAVLFRAYLQVKAERGPIVSEIEERDVDAWVERLREAGSKIPLGLLSWDGLSDLTWRLASRLSTSSTGTGSAGVPQSNGSGASAASSDDGVKPISLE